jgi:hypothetical protein
VSGKAGAFGHDYGSDTSATRSSRPSMPLFDVIVTGTRWECGGLGAEVLAVDYGQKGEYSAPWTRLRLRRSICANWLT